MTLEYIAALTATGESETLKFKETTGTRREAAMTVCAFLNERCGLVLLGVTSDGGGAGQQVSERTIEEEARYASGVVQDLAARTDDSGDSRGGMGPLRIPRAAEGRGLMTNDETFLNFQWQDRFGLTWNVEFIEGSGGFSAYAKSEHMTFPPKTVSVRSRVLR